MNEYSAQLAQWAAAKEEQRTRQALATMPAGVVTSMLRSRLEYFHAKDLVRIPRVYQALLEEWGPDMVREYENDPTLAELLADDED